VKFSDLLVVESGVGIAGPLVTRAFADLGARVLKIESSRKPDISRNRHPPPGVSREEIADVFPQIHEMNAGKSSVSLNLKTEQGRELFLDLLGRADVFAENFAPGWLGRIGLSHDAMQRRNPRLVILSQSPYGGEGPLSDQRAYAPIMTALSGSESLIGYEDGRSVPQISSSNGDLVAAYYGMTLALAALYERERTGRGALIDMSQTEACTCMAGVAMAEYGLTHQAPLPQGNRRADSAPHGHYPAAGVDRWVALAIWSDEEWQTLCEALACDDVARERFATVRSRLSDRAGVDELIAARTVLEERDDLFRRLQEVGLSCTPVLEVAEVDQLPEFAQRPLWASLPHPRAGEMRITRLPWRFEHLRQGPVRVADRQGESTERVMRDLLGCSQVDLSRWSEQAVFD
jgi:benzylsuccinate CoA-transferase BbsF subunit